MDENKTVVITGASSGIGREVAARLARADYNLFLTARSKKRLEDLAEELRTLNNSIEVDFGIGDVSNQQDVSILLEQVTTNLGQVDILFANAGVGYLYQLEQTPIEKFDEMINTNVKGVFLWLKAVLPGMRQRNSGQIIITSSTSAYRTWAEGSVYCATKHAIQGMVGGLRKELAGTNIKLATINPGAVDTTWFDKLEGFDSPEFDRDRMLKTSDIASSVMFLLNQSETSNIEHILQTFR